MVVRGLMVLVVGLLVGAAVARAAGALNPLAAAEAAEALAHYEAALAAMGDPPAALRFNAGLAAQRAGELARARELWRAAARAADDATAGRVAYNLGTLDYQAAVAALEGGDLEGAGARLGEARAALRRAVELAPGLEDARANLELTHQLERLIEQQRAQQQQQAPQEGGEQQEEGESGAEGTDGESRDARRSEDAEGGEAEPSQADGGEAAAGAGRDPASAEEGPDGDADEEEAGGELWKATPGDGEPGEAEGQRTPTPATVDGVELAPDAPLTADQIRLLLQRVRDRDRARRAQLRARAEAQVETTPVERDW
jgi:tetratricopeptide (TPR) repeat protein